MEVRAQLQGHLPCPLAVRLRHNKVCLFACFPPGFQGSFQGCFHILAILPDVPVAILDRGPHRRLLRRRALAPPGRPARPQNPPRRPGRTRRSTRLHVALLLLPFLELLTGGALQKAGGRGCDDDHPAGDVSGDEAGHVRILAFPLPAILPLLVPSFPRPQPKECSPFLSPGLSAAPSSGS